MTLTREAPNKEAARKMAIVDAMKPNERAMVWEIGLHVFSRKYPSNYKAAKRRAGIKGSCTFTQIAAVSRHMNKGAAK